MTAERLNSLRYRAWRRGFREADLILGPFADAELAGLSAADADAFEALLEVPDPELYAWILGREPIPAEHDGEVMRRIAAFARSGLSPDGLS